MPKQGCRWEVLEKTRGGASQYSVCRETATCATPGRQGKAQLHQEAERVPEAEEKALQQHQGRNMPATFGDVKPLGARRSRGRELIRQEEH